MNLEFQKNPEVRKNYTKDKDLKKYAQKILCSKENFKKIPEKFRSYKKIQKDSRNILEKFWKTSGALKKF